MLTESIDGDTSGSRVRTSMPTPATREPSPGRGCLLAVDLGGSKCRGVIADVTGTVVAEVVHATGVADAERALASTLDDLHAAAAARGLSASAAVLGIPALIAPSTGLAVAGPNVEWHGFDLNALLHDRLSVPFVVDNDVNLAGLGELWRGHGRASSGFVTLSIGTGVGAAVVLNGQVWRGFHNAAGEIGYMLAACRDDPGAGGAGARLEERISGRAIARRAQALAEAGTAGVQPETNLDARAVFRGAAQSGTVSEALVDRVVDEIAEVIVGLAAVVDPELVVLDGGVGRALEPWLGVLKRRVVALSTFPPRVVVSRLQPNATLVGAIERGLHFLGCDGQSKGDRSVIEPT